MKITLLLIGVLYARRHHHEGDHTGSHTTEADSGDSQTKADDNNVAQRFPNPNTQPVGPIPIPQPEPQPGSIPPPNGPPPNPNGPPPGIFVMSNDDDEEFGGSGHKKHHHHDDTLGRNEVVSQTIPVATVTAQPAAQLPQHQVTNSNDNSNSTSDDDAAHKSKDAARQAAQTPIVFASLFAMLIILPALFAGFKYYYNRRYRNENAPSRESKEYDDLAMPPPALMRLSLENMGNHKRVDSMGLNPLGFGTNGSDSESLVNSDEYLPRIGSGLSLGSSIIRNSNLTSPRNSDIVPNNSSSPAQTTLRNTPVSDLRQSINFNRLSTGSSDLGDSWPRREIKLSIGSSGPTFSPTPLRLSNTSGPTFAPSPLRLSNTSGPTFAPSPLRLSNTSETIEPSIKPISFNSSRARNSDLERGYSPSPLRLSELSGPAVQSTAPQISEISSSPPKLSAVPELELSSPPGPLNLEKSPTPIRNPDISGPRISTSNIDLGRLSGIGSSPTIRSPVGSGEATLGFSPTINHDSIQYSPTGRMATFSFVSVEHRDF
ncbi:hypothetical protein HDV06_005908 [Boothiomyces sp. JEL0866]|nr:hypothetical protein HDV06_005908 [Boothiomyces sp. JEL0866]